MNYNLHLNIRLFFNLVVRVGRHVLTMHSSASFQSILIYYAETTSYLHNTAHCSGFDHCCLIFCTVYTMYMVLYIYKHIAVSNSFCQFSVSAEMMDAQNKGMASVPKRAMNVMDCEVMRLLQLTQHAIVPVSYIVPRKVISLYLSICLTLYFIYLLLTFDIFSETTGSPTI